MVYLDNACALEIRMAKAYLSAHAHHGKALIIRSYHTLYKQNSWGGECAFALHSSSLKSHIVLAHEHP
jgi:hypothetical protein